jgi:hypothetical protein
MDETVFLRFVVRYVDRATPLGSALRLGVGGATGVQSAQDVVVVVTHQQEDTP